MVDRWFRNEPARVRVPPGKAMPESHHGTALPKPRTRHIVWEKGGRIPDEQNDLPIAVPVGAQPLHAVGLGYSGATCRVK
jgi:hypothetical protein